MLKMSNYSVDPAKWQEFVQRYQFNPASPSFVENLSGWIDTQGHFWSVPDHFHERFAREVVGAPSQLLEYAWVHCSRNSIHLPQSRKLTQDQVDTLWDVTAGQDPNLRDYFNVLMQQVSTSALDWDRLTKRAYRPPGLIPENPLPEVYQQLVRGDAAQKGLVVAEIVGVQPGVHGEDIAVLYNTPDHSTHAVLIPKGAGE
jgi:hypothetical protein